MRLMVKAAKAARAKRRSAPARARGARGDLGASGRLSTAPPDAGIPSDATRRRQQDLAPQIKVGNRVFVTQSVELGEYTLDILPDLLVFGQAKEQARCTSRVELLKIGSCQESGM